MRKLFDILKIKELKLTKRFNVASNRKPITEKEREYIKSLNKIDYELLEEIKKKWAI
jgi:hypothetical protein